MGELWNSRASTFDQHIPVFNPPSLQPASLNLPNFSAIYPPSSSIPPQQTTEPSHCQLGEVTSAFPSVSNARLQPPGVGLTSTPLRNGNHIIQENQLLSSSSDMQQAASSALSVTDLVMSEGEVVFPGTRVNRDSPSTDTQQENGVLRGKRIEQACCCPPLLNPFAPPSEPHPSHPDKEMGLQDLYPSVDAFLTQFGSSTTLLTARVKPDPSSGPPMLLSLSHHRSGEEIIPTTIPPPPPPSMAASSPPLLRMPPDPSDPPLYHPPIPAAQVPCTFFEQTAPQTRALEGCSLPHIPARPFVPVFAPPPSSTSQPGHTLPVLVLGDPLSQMQQNGFHLLKLPQPCVTNQSALEGGVQKKASRRGQRNHAGWDTPQKRVTDKDLCINGNQGRKDRLPNKTSGDNQTLLPNQARKFSIQEDGTLPETSERVPPHSRKRCVLCT